MTVETIAIGKVNLDISMRVEQLPGLREHAFHRRVTCPLEALQLILQCSQANLESKLV